jgi:PIN domain nuclease of toxin-antitoxin system
VRLLLDTHVALWWLNDPSALSDEARALVADGSNDAYLSSVSLWETAIKAQAGRLDTPTPTEHAARDAGFLELPVRWAHALRAATLPPLHRDPFDRMLVAQALEDNLVLLTRDPVVRQYTVATVAA